MGTGHPRSLGQVKCRWHPCGQPAIHTDPPLCDKHYEDHAENLRGPLFMPPKENPK